MVTLYIVFGILFMIGVAISIYAYRIYQEDKKLGMKKFKKREK